MGDLQSKEIVQADILTRQFKKQLKDAELKYEESKKSMKAKEEQIRRDHDDEMKRLEEKIMAKNYQEFLKMQNQNEEYQKVHLALLQKEHEVRLKEQEQALKAKINEVKSEALVCQNTRTNDLQQVWSF